MERVRRASVLFVAGISLALGHGLHAARAAETPPALLQGAWQASLLVQNGEKVEPREAGKLHLVISDKKITLRVGAQVIAETTYTVDAQSKPAAIDMTFQGQATLGIYDLNGDKLRICLNDQGKGRPKALPAVSGKGCDVDLWLFRVDHNWVLVHVLDADGGNPRLLVRHPDFIQQGSPEWSPDGTKIAFDACRPLLGEGWSDCHVLTCQADGKGLKDLGRGVQPSWSPDGKRLTFSSNDDPRGVMIMNADGTGREVIDQGGWGSHWCPKQNKIAYVKYMGGAALCVYDLTTKESRTVVDEGYRQIYYGMAWSPDGRWIAFKGVTPEKKNELVIVSAEGQKQGLRVLAVQGKGDVENIQPTVSWSVDSKQVLVGMVAKGNPALQLFAVDIDGKTPPKRLPKQPQDQSCFAVAMSPDGKQILVTTRLKGQTAPSSKPPVPQGNAAKLEVIDLKNGTGAAAEPGKTVVVHYRGTLTNGTEFDSSRKHGTPFSFKLGAGHVIAGWEKGIKGMKVGGTRKLVIPPQLAYGEKGAGDVIPPHATLLFEVELLEVK